MRVEKNNWRKNKHEYFMGVEPLTVRKSTNLLSSTTLPLQLIWGRTGLMVRASDSGSGDPGSILGRVGVFVSLSKRHLLPKSTGNTQE